MAVVAQVARVTHLLVHVVRRVVRAEVLLGGRHVEHAAADALHRHIGIADHATVLIESRLVLRRARVRRTVIAVVSDRGGLRVVGTQEPGQVAERSVRCDRDHEALPGLLLDRQFEVGVLARQAQRVRSLDPTLTALPGVEQVDAALGVDLVDEQIGVHRGAHLDAHGIARLVDAVVATIRPHVDVEASRRSGCGRGERQQRGRTHEQRERGGPTRTTTG